MFDDISVYYKFDHALFKLLRDLESQVFNHKGKTNLYSLKFLARRRLAFLEHRLDRHLPFEFTKPLREE